MKDKTANMAQVNWVDIADVEDDANSQWYTQKEARELAKRPDSEASSIGWILEDSDEWVVVAATRLVGIGVKETSYSGVHKIPKGCVKQIKLIRGLD